MELEIRQNYIIVDGVEQEITREFECFLQGERLDFREHPLRHENYLEIRNKSGRNITLIGVNDWCTSIKTSQAIVAQKGLMEYMSQYNI